MTAVSEAPLTIAASRERGYATRTTSYIPGSTVRGALAARWIREHGTPIATNPRRDEFIELFEGEIRYGPLIPETARFEPVSILRCKYEPDPKCADDPADAADGDPPVVCAHCGGPLERGKGRLLGISAREITRVSLDADETAVDGKLYSTEVLPPGTLFEGTIFGTHPWLAEDDEVRISVGRRKTVAGRLVVKMQPQDAPQTVIARPDGCVVIRLRTPAIVLDQWGAPSADFDLAEIAGLLGCDVAEIEPGHQSWCRVERTGGWHAASGLPKPDELLLSAGSTLVLRPDAPIAADQLTGLSSAALGVRVTEGFGIIEVNPTRWVPPMTAGPHTETVALANASKTLAAALSPADRRWLVGILRQHRADPTIPVHVPRRRLEELPPTARNLVVEFVRGPAGDELDALIKDLKAHGRGHQR